MMAEIVNLDAYRYQTAAERGFAPWCKRFGIQLAPKTTLADLPAAVVHQLVQPGEQSAFIYYELIMAVLDLGVATKFSYLPKPDQIRVLDTHLFLADQTRFEMMRRLGWLSHYPAQAVPLLEAILAFHKIRAATGEAFPQLAKNHPRYDEFSQLVDRDKGAFIRQLLPQALECFCGDDPQG